MYYESENHEPAQGITKVTQEDASGKYKALEGRIIALETMSGMGDEYFDGFGERVKSLERYVEKEFKALQAVTSVIENAAYTEIIPDEISDQIRKLTHIVADVTSEMNNMRRFVSIPIENNIRTINDAATLTPDYRAVIPDIQCEDLEPMSYTIPKTHDLIDQGEKRIPITEELRISLITRIDKLKQIYGKGAVTRIAHETGIPNSQISKLYNNKTKTLTQKQIDALMSL